MQAIRTERLVRRFGGITALDEISFEVSTGGFFALLGPDGAGKSTLCRILAGILDPSGGQAWVAGHDVVREREGLKEIIGYMPQNFGLYPDLTVDENIEFYADLYGVSRRERQTRKQRLLEMTSLAPFTSRPAGKLSGGMKQKLTLAACLIHTPQVLILDEPTLGVDPVSRREFWKLLYDLLKQGVHIFVATSYMDEAQRCSQVAVLYQGRIIACAEPREIRASVPGVMLEVMPADLPATVRLARSIDVVRTVTPFGETIHILTRDVPGAEDRVRALLATAGISADQISTVTPSMEDAFIYLVGDGAS